MQFDKSSHLIALFTADKQWPSLIYSI